MLTSALVLNSSVVLQNSPHLRAPLNNSSTLPSESAGEEGWAVSTFIVIT